MSISLATSLNRLTRDRIQMVRVMTFVVAVGEGDKWLVYPNVAFFGYIAGLNPGLKTD